MYHLFRRIHIMFRILIKMFSLDNAEYSHFLKQTIFEYLLYYIIIIKTVYYIKYIIQFHKTIYNELILKYNSI